MLCRLKALWKPFMYMAPVASPQNPSTGPSSISMVLPERMLAPSGQARQRKEQHLEVVQRTAREEERGERQVQPLEDMVAAPAEAGS